MGSPTDIASTTEKHQDQPLIDETALPSLDCFDEIKEDQSSECSWENLQERGCYKEYSDFRQDSNNSCYDRTEDLYPTEEDGDIFTPGHMRESMSSFTGRPGIKGRNETIRMTLLCAVHCMSGYKAESKHWCKMADLVCSNSRNHVHMGC